MSKLSLFFTCLFLTVCFSATAADFSWHPQEPAEWEKQQSNKTPAANPAPASRWSAEEIARQQAQLEEISQKNEQYFRQQQRDKDARNPACSHLPRQIEDDRDESWRQDPFNIERLHHNQFNDGPDSASFRKMFTGCSDERLEIKLGE